MVLVVLFWSKGEERMGKVGGGDDGMYIADEAVSLRLRLGWASLSGCEEVLLGRI